MLKQNDNKIIRPKNAFLYNILKTLQAVGKNVQYQQQYRDSRYGRIEDIIKVIKQKLKIS